MSGATRSTVYLVGFDAPTQRSWERMLSDAGYGVSVVESDHELLSQQVQRAPSPRCILLSTNLPPYDHLTVPQDVIHSLSTPLILVAEHVELRSAITAVHQGVFDIVIKSMRPNVVFDVVDRALRRDLELCERQVRVETYRTRRAQLTKRETEVLDLVLAGCNTKQISARLSIGIATVLKHKTKMLQKMGVRNDVELALLASFCDEQPVASLVARALSSGTMN